MAPGAARPRPDLARRTAYDLLRAVDEHAAYANLALAGLLRERRLEPRDAAFVTELGYGTLRLRGTYDAVIAACIDRPLARVDAPVLDVLRLGAHQLLGMRVPPHAAVAATVELARAVVGESRGRFVNAVLRRIGGNDLAGWLAKVAPGVETDPVGHLAVTTSHPRWVVEAIRTALGAAAAELRDALEADNVAAEVALVARPGRAEVAELLAAGARPGRWSPHAALLPSGDPGGIEAVRARRAGVQDEGSQLVALAAAVAPLDGRDERWLDVCAGPGGKAALLAGLATQRGAQLVAGELAPHRARLVAGALDGTGTTLIADGTRPPWRDGSFDRVLVDAPCSGLGALRRRPEARWRRTPADLTAIGPLQRTLLRSALDAVRPGGVVTYATCSPHRAETVAVVEDVLSSRPDAERLDARGCFPPMPQLGDGPDVQLWPHRHGTDAMYVAMLRRGG